MTDFDLEIPAAGAPFQPETHPQNQALLESELAKRLEMRRAKLSRLQLWNLRREFTRLQKKLNRAGYNRLILERHECSEAFREAVAAYKEKATPARYKKAEQLRAAGKALNARIAELQPLLSQFEDVAARLNAHDKILQLEKEEKENQRKFFEEAETWEQLIYAVFENSPRLHYVQKSPDGKERIITPIIDHVFMKADKLYFRIRLAKQNFIQRFRNRWSSGLPYGVDIKSLTSDETIQNLTAACGRVVTVERSPRSQNLFYVINRMDSADGIPKKIYYNQIVDHYPVEKHAVTPWAAGVGEDRKIVHFDFEQFPNVLIAGSAGGGKSNLANSMIVQTATMNSPDEVRFVLIDNKGGIELIHFENLPHLLMPPVISVENVLPTLKMISAMMKERYAMFLKIKAKKLVEYNKKVKNPIPRILVFIDEMVSLLGLEDTSEIQDELRLISAQGRATGIHLIVATQHPSVDVLPGWIKTNLHLRIASRMPNHNASQIVVDSITAAFLPDNPGRMVFRLGGFEMVLQTPLITDEEIARTVKTLQNAYPALPAISEPEKTEADTDEYKPMSDVMAEASEDAPAPDESPAAVLPAALKMEEPKPKFGREEYLRAALELDGSLSPTKVYEHIAKKYMTQAEARRFGDDLVEQLAKEGEVLIDGIRYMVKPLARGYKLEQFVDDFVEKTDEAIAVVA